MLDDAQLAEILLAPLTIDEVTLEIRPLRAALLGGCQDCTQFVPATTRGPVVRPT